MRMKKFLFREGKLEAFTKKKLPPTGRKGNGLALPKRKDFLCFICRSGEEDALKLDTKKKKKGTRYRRLQAPGSGTRDLEETCEDLRGGNARSRGGDRHVHTTIEANQQSSRQKTTPEQCEALRSLLEKELFERKKGGWALK